MVAGAAGASAAAVAGAVAVARAGAAAAAAAAAGARSSRNKSRSRSSSRGHRRKSSHSHNHSHRHRHRSMSRSRSRKRNKLKGQNRAESKSGPVRACAWEQEGERHAVFAIRLIAFKCSSKYQQRRCGRQARRPSPRPSRRRSARLRAEVAVASRAGWVSQSSPFLPAPRAPPNYNLAVSAGLQLAQAIIQLKLLVEGTSARIHKASLSAPTTHSDRPGGGMDLAVALTQTPQIINFPTRIIRRAWLRSRIKFTAAMCERTV